MAAAGKFKTYDLVPRYMTDGTFDADLTTNWKLALFLSTSNANTLGGGIDVYGDLTNEHANANGYTTGGVALTNWVGSYPADGVKWTCDPAIWTASGGSIVARFGVIYNNATLNTIVKPLFAICLLDATPANVTATDGNTLTITMNASGIYTLTGAQVD